MPRNRFRQHPKLAKSGKHPRILLSRECGKFLDRRLKEISSLYPNARVLLFFRRHDQWIASHYRRYVKNGGTRNFKDYIDIENDLGIWKQQQLVYMDMIDKVSEYLNTPAFVLTYDELQSDLESFNKKLAHYLDASIDPNRISSARVHKSYSEQQLIKMRMLCRKLAISDPEVNDFHQFAHRTRRRLSLYRNYVLLLLCKLIPFSAGNDEELIQAADLQRIRQHYADDWQSLLDYAARQDNSDS
ncbi:MAG: hypothetical protein ACI9FD_003494 [Gammaproteobacteria bacterium]